MEINKNYNINLKPIDHNFYQDHSIQGKYIIRNCGGLVVADWKQNELGC